MRRLAIISGLLGLLILAWFVAYLYYDGFINIRSSISLQNAESIGGFVGGFVGVFFSLAGIFLLIETLNLQREESRTSADLSRRQQFESNFFQLLNLHHQLVTSIDTAVLTEGEKDVSVKGRSFFDDFCSVMFQECEQHENELTLDKQKRVFSRYYHIHITDIDHYFRSLYHIVKYVDATQLIPDTEKYHYVKILRAQLSNSELICLGYNGLTERGKNFKPLLEKYKLLKNISFELNLDKEYQPRIIKPENMASEYLHLASVFDEQRNHHE